jgi:hypothetical protein
MTMTPTMDIRSAIVIQSRHRHAVRYHVAQICRQLVDLGRVRPEINVDESDHEIDGANETPGRSLEIADEVIGKGLDRVKSVVAK